MENDTEARSESLQFRVEQEDAGLRIDRYLADRLAARGVSRSRIRDLFDQSAIRIDGSPPKASARVQAGDLVEVDLPPPPPAAAEPEDIPLRILYEDAHLIVVDKDAGMVVHPTHGHETGTLVNALLHHCGLSSIGAPLRPGVVHRIDKGTSGLVMAAKDDPTHLALKVLFQGRRVFKEYVGVAYGKLNPPDGRFEEPIARSRRDRTKMAISGSNPRAAATGYRTLEQIGGQFSYLSLNLQTGRTHQIRVHLSAAGHPLVGDDKYGGDRWKGLPSGRLRSHVRKLQRPFLHAHRLAFDHPATGERLELVSQLPDDLAGWLAELRNVIE